MHTFQSKNSFTPLNNQKTAQNNFSSQRVQMLSASPAAAANPPHIHEVALAGVQGPSSQLPYLDKIQSAFGQHDMSHVQAYLGPQAAGANTALGARAYAIGDKIAFAEANPSLHTVAHETAHVLQQRAGVQLDNGVGKAGDSYEQEADKIAGQVVQGHAVDLLNTSQITPQATSIQFLREKENVDVMNVEEEEPSFNLKRKLPEIEPSSTEAITPHPQKRLKKLAKTPMRGKQTRIKNKPTKAPSKSFQEPLSHQSSNLPSSSHESAEPTISSSGITGMEQLMRGKEFVAGKEKHRLYLGDYEGKGWLELIIESHPWPFDAYMGFLAGYPPQNPAETAAKKDLREKYDKMLADLKTAYHPQSKNYNSASILALQEFLNHATTALEGPLQNSLQQFTSTRSGGDFNTAPIPDTSDLNRSYKGYHPFSNIAGENYQCTAGINVPILSAKGPVGGPADGPKDDSHNFLLREKIGQKDGGQHYTEGHLLNHWLHGPGNDWHNLALIPSATNDATAKYDEPQAAETWAKYRVLGLNQVLSYEVDVEYNRNQDPTFNGFYEQLLPSGLVYNLHRKVPKQGAMDTRQSTEWEDSTSNQDRLNKSYPCNLANPNKKWLTPIENGPADPLLAYKDLIENAIKAARAFSSIEANEIAKTPGMDNTIFQQFKWGVQAFDDFVTEYKIRTKYRKSIVINSLLEQQIAIKPYAATAERILEEAHSRPKKSVVSEPFEKENTLPAEGTKLTGEKLETTSTPSFVTSKDSTKEAAPPLFPTFSKTPETETHTASSTDQPRNIPPPFVIFENIDDVNQLDLALRKRPWFTDDQFEVTSGRMKGVYGIFSGLYLPRLNSREGKLTIYQKQENETALSPSSISLPPETESGKASFIAQPTKTLPRFVTFENIDNEDQLDLALMKRPWFTDDQFEITSGMMQGVCGIFSHIYIPGLHSREGKVIIYQKQENETALSPSSINLPSETEIKEVSSTEPPIKAIVHLENIDNSSQLISALEKRGWNAGDEFKVTSGLMQGRRGVFLENHIYGEPLTANKIRFKLTGG